MFRITNETLNPTSKLKHTLTHYTCSKRFKSTTFHRFFYHFFFVGFNLHWTITFRYDNIFTISIKNIIIFNMFLNKCKCKQLAITCINCLQNVEPYNPYQDFQKTLAYWYHLLKLVVLIPFLFRIN